MSTVFITPDPYLPANTLMEAEGLDRLTFTAMEKEMDRIGVLAGTFIMTPGGQRRYRYSAWKNATSELAKVHYKAVVNS